MRVLSRLLVSDTRGLASSGGFPTLSITTRRSTRGGSSIPKSQRDGFDTSDGASLQCQRRRGRHGIIEIPPATHNSCYSSRGLSEKPRDHRIATVWTNKHAASSRTSVKDDRNAVVPQPANDGLHECMVDLTYQIGGLLREGAERAVSKPKGASGRSGSYPTVLAHLLGDRQGPLAPRCRIRRARRDCSQPTPRYFRSSVIAWMPSLGTSKCTPGTCR